MFNSTLTNNTKHKNKVSNSMTKRRHGDIQLSKEIVNCVDPKEEIDKLLGEIANDKDKRDKSKDRATLAFLMREAYPILFVVKFVSGENAMTCAFTTRDKIEEFASITNTMNPVVDTVMYAVSGTNEMRKLIKAAGLAMPCYVDEIDYYAMKLIEKFNVKLNLAKRVRVFLEDISGRKTSDLVQFERSYIDQIKKSFNKEFEKTK